MCIRDSSEERVEAVGDAVAEGDAVWVVVTEIKEPGKYSLSMRLVDQGTGELKEPLDDRDAAAAPRRPRDDQGAGEPPPLYSVLEGTVARIQPFGAFVRMENGYGDGLVHVSQMCSYRAGKGCENPNFKGSYLGRFPLVSADFWTSDHLSLIHI